MELGWIDFSTTDRDIVMGVLDILGEKGVLDELGIAPIRDYFSDLFFPGTSTIQTRAKYFLIVPYILRDLELNKQLDFFKLKKELSAAEENCGHILLEKNHDENGIIGKRSIQNGKWVNRPPSSIYWSGLRQYNIVKYNISIDDYIKVIISHKKKRKSFSLGNLKDKNEGSSDDKFALSKNYLDLLNIPTYSENWLINLDINLTPEESEFLKNQIILTCKDKMLSYILLNEELVDEVLQCDSFNDLQAIIPKFPEEIQANYFRALSFSEFVFALRVIYNVLVSNEKNENATNWLNSLNLKEISKIDMNDIINSCDIENPSLIKFLTETKDLMEHEDVEGLKECIKSREIYLKGNRAKSLHIGEFDPNLWFGGEKLDYRFQNAKTIIQDIMKTEEVSEDVESKQ